MDDTANRASRVLELSSIISANTKRIDDFFAKEGLPSLSFDPTAPGDFPVPNSNEEIQQARRAVVLATQELHDLRVGPREHIRWMAWSYNDNVSLQACWNFKIAQAVPRDGEISWEDLSKAVGVNFTDLKRTVRHAMTNFIFREPRPGYVAHTAASIILLDDKAMNDWIGVCAGNFFQAGAKTVQTMEKYPGSQEATESPYSEFWCPEKPLFAHIGANPELARRFGGAMVSLTGGEGYELSYLIDNYPWAELDRKGGTFVDVGGSVGFVCVALAQKFPNMKFVVQDMAKTIANGPASVPEDLRDRIQFQAHDFYTPQPVKDADVYFFRWICHNQSDKYGVKMMQSLIPALKPGAKIVIHDNCLPTPGTIDKWDDKITRTMDMTMLSLLNAKERDDADWLELFRMSDPGFKYLGSKTPRGSRMSIMEAVWQPEANGHHAS